MSDLSGAAVLFLRNSKPALSCIAARGTCVSLVAGLAILVAFPWITLVLVRH